MSNGDGNSKKKKKKHIIMLYFTTHSYCKLVDEVIFIL